jgi:hypothetical protein
MTNVMKGKDQWVKPTDYVLLDIYGVAADTGATSSLLWRGLS